MHRDYGKAKADKVQAKPDATQKAKKPKEKKEAGEEEWQTVVRKGSGQMTKQVLCVHGLMIVTPLCTCTERGKVNGFVCLSVCPPVCLSVRLSVCLSVDTPNA